MSPRSTGAVSLSHAESSRTLPRALQSRLKLPQVEAERAGYLQVAEEHLYTVLHPVAKAHLRVLLVGSFAQERNSTYLPLVRWARYLAMHGVEVLRFDARGVGESTGEFQRMSFSTWQDDIRLLVHWCRLHLPEAPLVLHGLGLGALLAANVFRTGVGDGLLLWSSPPSANAMLRSELKRWLTVENMKKVPADRKPLSFYVNTLEQGGSLEVNGYCWTADFWRDSLQCVFPSSMADGEAGTPDDGRPVRIVALGKAAIPLVRGGIAGYEESNELEWLYSETLSWMQGAVPQFRSLP